VMKIKRDYLSRIVLIFAILSAAAIFMNLVAVHIYKKQVFIENELFSAIEYVILFGFCVVFLFILLSIFWLAQKTRNDGVFVRTNTVLLLYGLLCLVAFIGQKVMADEIGRELRLGWEVQGEFIIISILFVIQFVFSLLIAIRIISGKEL
jgi:hypothetical protein